MAQPDEAIALCARHITPAPDERILLLGCGQGALGVSLARAAPRGQVILSDPDWGALQAARRSLELAQVSNAEVSVAISQLPGLAGQLDRVLILGPQSRGLARRWLVEALALLRPGGALNLAGANRLGVQSLIADATALFGAANTLALGKGCRLAQLIRPAAPPAPPTWAAAGGIAPGTWHTLTVQLPLGQCELFSLPGVFSYEHLDPGTDLLLRSLALPTGVRVLDVGCGYGPIGIAAAAAGATWVDMLDINLLAVATARANAARYGLRGDVLASAGLTAVAGRRYDLLISNPPFHAGARVDTAATEAFIAGSRALLDRGGRLALVANRFLPYARLMAAHFSRVTCPAEDRSYQVLVGEG